MRPTRSWIDRPTCLRYGHGKLGPKQFRIVWDAYGHLLTRLGAFRGMHMMRDQLAWLHGDGLRILKRTSPGIRELEKQLRLFAGSEAPLDSIHARAARLARDLDALRADVVAMQPALQDALEFYGRVLECQGPFRRIPRAWSGDTVRLALVEHTLMRQERFPLSPSVWAHLGIGLGLDPLPRDRLVRGELWSAARVFRETVAKPWKKVLGRAKPGPGEDVRHVLVGLREWEVDPGPYLSGAKHFGPHPDD